MKQITIATYNICHGHYAGLDYARLGEIIRSSEADVVGLQEVDMFTNRAGGADSLKALSESADMPYTLFIPAMDYDGGQYGTAILSRLPMESVKVGPIHSDGFEPRSLGIASVTLEDGTKVGVANTHLSYEDQKTRLIQIKQISFRLCTLLPANSPILLTGDFNTEDPADFGDFRTAGFGLVNLDDADYKTFPSTQIAIDNILYRKKALTPIAHGVIECDASDHHLLWCRFQLN